MFNGQRKSDNSKGQRNVWFISFESIRLASAGGLGDAVANLSEALSGKSKITILIPSHGRHTDREVRRRLELKDSGLSFKGERIGYDGSRHPYEIGVEEGSYLGVRYLIFKGLDHATSDLLHNPLIYGDELTYQKASLLARGVKGIATFILQQRKLNDIPHVIHMHDWHAVPSGVSAWQAFNERRVYPALVFSIHLLSFKRLPWHYASEQWSGLKEQGHYINFGNDMQFVDSFRTVWESFSDSSLEKFASYEADFITTVSSSYLEQSLIPYLGKSIENKCSYVYNGCDWNYADMINEVSSMLKNSMTDNFSRRRFRAFFIDSLLPSVATPNSSLKSVRLKDGPLVLATGRADRQKGIDLLLDSVQYVIKIIPAAKFLLLLLPSGDSSYQESLEKKAQSYRENLIMVTGDGNTSKIYRLAYLASDVYAMPSRWEPFGITALEAMATGNPVVGSRTGGITETVIDLSSDFNNGTGLLINPDNSNELADAITSLLIVMEADGKDPNVRNELSKKVPLGFLRQVVNSDVFFGSKLRNRCITRVQQNFTWKHSAIRMEACYETAIEYAKERSRASY